MWNTECQHKKLNPKSLEILAYEIFSTDNMEFFESIYFSKKLFLFKNYRKCNTNKCLGK